MMNELLIVWAGKVTQDANGLWCNRITEQILNVAYFKGFSAGFPFMLMNNAAIDFVNEF